MELTKAEEKVIESLVNAVKKSDEPKQKFGYKYYWSEELDIASKTWIKKCVTNLEKKLGLIEVKIPEKKGRKRNFYGLTFKGLLYALNVGNIKPAEAAEIRQKSRIKLPKQPDAHTLDTNLWMKALSEIWNADAQSRKFFSEFRERTGLDYYHSWQQAYDKYLAMADVILEKHGVEQSLLQRRIELMISEKLYTALRDMTNLDFYNEYSVGFLFHSLLNKHYRDLSTNAFAKGKSVAFIYEIMKEDDVTREVIQKAWIPYMIKCPEISAEQLNLLKRLSNMDPKTFMEVLGKTVFKKSR